MITLTGDWASPLILTPLPTVILAAYGWGYREGLAAAALTGATIALADVLSGVSEDALRTGDPRVGRRRSSPRSSVASPASSGSRPNAGSRRRSTRSRACRSRTTCCTQLHDVVQTLPSSLDLSDVVTSAQETFRELVDSTVAVVLVPDDTSDLWHVELAEGVAPARDRSRPTSCRSTLAAALATHRRRPGQRPRRPAPARRAAPTSRSVLATALRAHDRVVGLVSIEHREPDAYTEEDASLIAGLASSLALAVDNARWFSRLRTLGAEAERARIARDLHDNVAQSLAYVGFELDRLAAATATTRSCGSCRASCAASWPNYAKRSISSARPSARTRTWSRSPATTSRRWSNRTGVDAEFSPQHRGPAGCRSRSSRSSGGSSRNRSRTSSDMPMPPTHGSAGGLVMVGRSSKFVTTGAA